MLQRRVVHYIVLMLAITIGFIQSICLRVNPMQGSSLHDNSIIPLEN